MKKVLTLLCFCCGLSAFGQGDSTFCADNAARNWWHVIDYDIQLSVDTAKGYLNGRVYFDAGITGAIGDTLQIDLQDPLMISELYLRYGGKQIDLPYRKEGKAYKVWGDFKRYLHGTKVFRLYLTYEGAPRIAAHAPWDGGIVLDRSKRGKPWIGMACQDDGASIWLPCKDFQGEEPEAVRITITVPRGLTAISNGRLVQHYSSKTTLSEVWVWKVTNPINLYDISFYIGDYVHWSDTLKGLMGKLSLDYYVLREHLAKAKKQFAVVKPMLTCFEEKIGPYPFYEDGYKLVEAPYLGMEHQSAIAYGNGYRMGYQGKDRGETGAGLDFDFIIVHESGHEWFGNSITAYDKADTWIHEGFTTYTETIFEECLKGKKRAFMYQEGKKKIVKNDRPVQGLFNQCDEGSGDHYDKAAMMIHTIRILMKDDVKFFAMLREMNVTFYHKIVTGKEVEQFISTYSGTDFSKVFDQYLRQANIPVLELKTGNNQLTYYWSDCVPGFNMPVLLYLDHRPTWIYPSTAPQQLQTAATKIQADEGFLIKTELK